MFKLLKIAQKMIKKTKKNAFKSPTINENSPSNIKQYSQKTFNLNEQQLSSLFRAVELQREFVYHLQKYKESCELKNKELELLNQKAQLLAKHNNSFNLSCFCNLNESERKELKRILQLKHIHLNL